MRKKRQLLKDASKIMLVFKHAQIVCDCNPDQYGKEKAQQIQQAVQQLARQICIDRTYSEYPDSKYEKTFVTEQGWKDLCQTLQRTSYGKKATKEDNDLLHEMYKLMILQYLYQCLEDLGYHIEDIHLEIANKSRFMVEILEDTTTDSYPGKWQTWDT